MRHKRAAVLAAVVLIAVVPMPVAAHNADAVSGNGDYAQVNIEEAGAWDAFIHAGWYADQVFATSDLEDCRSRADVIAEIQAHAIGQFATDPIAGLTCAQFLD